MAILAGDVVPRSPSSPGFYKNKGEGGPEVEDPGTPSHTLCSRLPGPICCVDEQLDPGLSGKGVMSSYDHSAQSQGSVCRFLGLFQLSISLLYIIQ